MGVIIGVVAMAAGAVGFVAGLAATTSQTDNVIPGSSKSWGLTGAGAVLFLVGLVTTVIAAIA